MKGINFLIFLLLVLFSDACQEKSPTSAVLNSDPKLKKTNSGWLYKGLPFSGFMVEKEKDGRVVYQLPIRRGKENGLAIAWYNSGEKLIERKFIDGKKEGVFKQWWPNGNLRYLFYYENDLLEGSQLVFFPNGKKREESSYHLGEKEGVQRVWDEKELLVSNYTVKNKKTYGIVSVKSCMPVGH